MPEALNAISCHWHHGFMALSCNLWLILSTKLRFKEPSFSNDPVKGQMPCLSLNIWTASASMSFSCLQRCIFTSNEWATFPLVTRCYLLVSLHQHLFKSTKPNLSRFLSSSRAGDYSTMHRPCKKVVQWSHFDRDEACVMKMHVILAFSHHKEW